MSIYREPRLLYAFTRHPDVKVWRETPRHLVNADDPGWTLCGHRIVWTFDYATPLTRDCGNCARSTRTPATR